MENKFFEELSRRLREGGIESSNVEDKRLEVFLHGRPVLFVSPGHDAFLLPAGSQNQKASELYHRVAGMADEVYEYVEAVQNAPLLRASSLKDEFHLLADFGGAVLAGIELPKEWGYQFNTWIWNYDRTALLYGHNYMGDFQSAKQDFAVRAGLVESQRLFSDEQIAVIKNACEFALEDDATLSYAEEKQLHSVQEQIELLLPQQERNQHPTMEQTM